MTIDNRATAAMAVCLIHCFAQDDGDGLVFLVIIMQGEAYLAPGTHPKDADITAVVPPHLRILEGVLVRRLKVGPRLYRLPSQEHKLTLRPVRFRDLRISPLCPHHEIQ